MMSRRYWLCLISLTLLISALVLDAQTFNPLPASPWGRQLIRDSNALAGRDRLYIPTVSVLDFDAVGDGVTDDTNAVQYAIDKAIAANLELLLPAGTYRITDTLHVGDGTAEVLGFAWRGVGAGRSTLLWDGPNDVNFVQVLSCSQTLFERMTIDGNDANGVTGIYHSTGGAFSSQHMALRQVQIKDCNAVGYWIKQVAAATCDYLLLDDCTLGGNGVNLRVEGGARQVQTIGGSNISAATYGIEIVDGSVTIYDGLFGLNGYDFDSSTQVGSDIYLSGEIANVQVFGGKTESLVFLDGNWSLPAGWSRLLTANTLHNVNQSGHTLLGGVVAIDETIDYNCVRPLLLTGCKFMGDVNLGTQCSSIISLHTDFYNYDRDAGDADPITGFVGTLTNLNILGRTDNSVGEGSLSGSVLLGGQTLLVADDGWFRGIDILDDSDAVYKRIGFADASPVTYYARVGWIAYNVNPTSSSEPLGWRCITAGDGPAETTLAVFQPFYADASGLESVNLPAADDPTTDDNGDIAWDTNDLQLQGGDGTNEFYLASKVKQYSITIDNPDGLTDPNILMLSLDPNVFPAGVQLQGLAIKTRPVSSYTVTVLDYNEPNDQSPTTLGTCATSLSNEAAASLDATVATGSILVVRLPDTDINQLQVILYAYVRTKD